MSEDMPEYSMFPLLVGLTVIISGVAEITEHVAEIVQTVVVVVPALVHEIQLLDPGHPFIRILLLVAVGLVLLRRGGGQVNGGPAGLY